MQLTVFGCSFIYLLKKKIFFDPNMFVRFTLLPSGPHFHWSTSNAGSGEELGGGGGGGGGAQLPGIPLPYRSPLPKFREPVSLTTKTVHRKSIICSQHPVNYQSTYQSPDRMDTRRSETIIQLTNKAKTQFHCVNKL